MYIYMYLSLSLYIYIYIYIYSILRPLRLPTLAAMLSPRTARLGRLFFDRDAEIWSSRKVPLKSPDKNKLKRNVSSYLPSNA